MGALTNKPFMFTFRTWELQDVLLFDIFEAIHISTTIQYDGLRILRILPRLQIKNYNIEWLADPSRYFFDGLLKNRLINLIYYHSCYKVYLSITWTIVIKLIIFLLKINDFETCFKIIFNKILCYSLLLILSNWLDILHVYNLKNFLLKMGCTSNTIIYNKGLMFQTNISEFQFRYFYNISVFDKIVNIIKKKDSNVLNLLSNY
jgi:hypothetical protein